MRAPCWTLTSITTRSGFSVVQRSTALSKKGSRITVSPCCLRMYPQTGAVSFLSQTTNTLVTCVASIVSTCFIINSFVANNAIMIDILLIIQPKNHSSSSQGSCGCKRGEVVKENVPTQDGKNRNG